ncbi:TetR/AcrR family transcriptional regulator [Rubellimicrobium aerolatum]|uniref:TetR/AcrR family transcriptional regulator n=1 Tax=Rubellimicrobium aerolatum TaxID=490979 RepID=A0ABW0SBZ5_9RHOB|nr:TetR/AcrR family transcriptional regulator [Rubellimicrobium aerolatum]MBP1806022.1 TetR/AcrR family transcriptional regulator of autoinduction and epiphytic fitness [Rubellimicrobium aerolatum]
MRPADETILVPEPGAPTRRHAAGEDPAKRDQILEGARRVFMEQGYDVASMNDICRAAGVSKGTIYVYFENKEELFVSLIERERDRLFLDTEQLLASDLPLAEKLRRFAARLAGIVCSDEGVRAQRILIATAQRMPELGARFYDGGPKRTQDALAALLAREVEAGRLRIGDVTVAAAQFVALATAGIWRPRLFGKDPEPPSAEAVGVIADAAVAMFLAAHGVEER